MRCKAIFRFLWKLSFDFENAKSPKNPAKKHIFQKKQTHKNQTKTKPAQSKCPAFFQKLSKNSKTPLNRASLNFALIFCVWLLLLLLVLQHHRIIIILIIPFVFISCQSRGSVSCQSSRGKAIYFQIPINLVSFVLCAYLQLYSLVPQCTYISLSVCHSSACACIPK